MVQSAKALHSLVYPLQSNPAEMMDLSDYFDWCPEAVVVLDPTSLSILTVNAAFSSLVAPMYLVCGKPFVETLIRREDHSRIEDVIYGAQVTLCKGKSNVQATRCSTLVIGADGQIPQWYQFDWVAKFHRSVVILSGRQVTALSEAEEMAREEFADFFNHAPIALHWLSSAGHVLWANATEMELLGYSPEEYIGQPIMKFCPDDEECVIEIFKQLGSGNSIHDVPVRFRTKAGEIRHLLVDSNVNWNPDGSFKHTRCFIRDDTARKVREARQEAELKAQTEMAQEKDAFIQKLFHEIRTPCHSLQMVVQLMLAAAADGELKSQLETAWAQAVHISKLADDVRCAMLLQVGQAPALQEQWFDIAATISDTQVMLQNLFPNTTLQVNMNDGDFLMFSDPTLFAAILRQLLSNALKWATGPVQLLVNRSRGESSKDILEVHVSNPGPGIDVECIHRIWQKYWQTSPLQAEEGSRLDAASGFGLGLFIAFNYVQLFGGQLQVKSESGVTTFWFTMEVETCNQDAIDDNFTSTGPTSPVPSSTPGDIATYSFPTEQPGPVRPTKKSLWKCLRPWAHRKPQSNRKSSTTWTSILTTNAAKHHLDLQDGLESVKSCNPLQTISVKPKAHILVVDDNTICQKVVGRCLETLGCGYTVAANGKIACALVETNPLLFDVILMDIRMPVMDGIAATHHLRNKLHILTPIIAFSAEVGSDVMDEIMTAGATNFLAKPATPQSLAQALKQLNVV